MADLSRRRFAAGLGAALGADMLQAARSDHPNIVFICSDQHSGRILGANGHREIRTPHLDRLASLGVNFRNAYCGSPVCVPSRAGFMTGMYPSDVGSYCNSTPFDGRVPTWGSRLRAAGYDCWATGKLDLEAGKDYGFQEHKTNHGHSVQPDITSLFRVPLCYRINERKDVNGEFRDHTHADEARLRDALAFLRTRAAAPSETRGRPWTMYVGFTQPHPPFIAQAKYLEMYPPDRVGLPAFTPEYLEQRHLVFQELASFKMISTPIPEARQRRARAAYYGMLTELDSRVGRILEAIEEAGQLRDTLIVYTSDHGEMLGENGLWLKNVLLENAARVPLILAGAGLPRGKTIETPASHADMVATILDIAGVTVLREMRGHSLIQAGHPGFAYSESHSEGNCTGSFMIRKDDWKYIYFTWYDPLLFNLKDDPGEMRNLAGRPETASVQQELHAILTRLVNPDAITKQALAEQDRRLKTMLAKNSPAQLLADLAPRLGKGQARALVAKYYQ